jgi:hypothetical protein
VAWCRSGLNPTTGHCRESRRAPHHGTVVPQTDSDGAGADDDGGGSATALSDGPAANHTVVLNVLFLGGAVATVILFIAVIERLRDDE